MAHEGRTAVYWLYGERDVLLYVGIARDPRARWRQHAASKAWWGDVVTRTVEWFPTLAEAREVETGAIREALPLHNSMGSVARGDVVDALPSVNLMEAKDRLHELVDAAAVGEPTIVARRGKPLAVIVSYQQLKSEVPQ